MIYKLLEKLCNADIENAKKIAIFELKKYLDVVEEHEGYIIAYKKDKNPKIIFDAHIDQIGFIVSFITEDGFIGFECVGGIDQRILPATPVCCNNLTGVITSTPPHLSKDKDSVIKKEDLYIDFGFSTKENAEKCINLGDRIFFDTPCRKLQEDNVTAHSLDDRAGVAAILTALEMAKNNENDTANSPIIIFSDMEEIGERGVKIALNRLKNQLDEAIAAVAVDVSFAYAIDEKKEKCGEFGKGPMLGISPSLSKKFSNYVIETAKKHQIPYQLEIMPQLTSTNADQFSAQGIPTTTISIPLRYMHTPTEIVNLGDVLSTAKLLFELLSG